MIEGFLAQIQKYNVFLMFAGIHFNVNLKKVYMTMTPVCRALSRAWSNPTSSSGLVVMPPNKPEKLLLTKHHQNVLMMGKLLLQINGNICKIEMKNMNEYFFVFFGVLVFCGKPFKSTKKRTSLDFDVSYNFKID